MPASSPAQVVCRLTELGDRKPLLADDVICLHLIMVLALAYPLLNLYVTGEGSKILIRIPRNNIRVHVMYICISWKGYATLCRFRAKWITGWSSRSTGSWVRLSVLQLSSFFFWLSATTTWENSVWRDMPSVTECLIFFWVFGKLTLLRVCFVWYVQENAFQAKCSCEFQACLRVRFESFIDVTRRASVAAFTLTSQNSPENFVGTSNSCVYVSTKLYMYMYICISYICDIFNRMKIMCILSFLIWVFLYISGIIVAYINHKQDIPR